MSCWRCSQSGARAACSPADPECTPPPHPPQPTRSHRSDTLAASMQQAAASSQAAVQADHGSSAATHLLCKLHCGCVRARREIQAQQLVTRCVSPVPARKQHGTGTNLLRHCIQQRCCRGDSRIDHHRAAINAAGVQRHGMCVRQEVPIQLGVLLG